MASQDQMREGRGRGMPRPNNRKGKRNKKATRAKRERRERKGGGKLAKPAVFRPNNFANR